MRILVIHNEYTQISGEETSLQHVVDLLKSRGHDVLCYRRSSAEIANSRWGRAKAFFSGMYSASSRNELKNILKHAIPDVVFIKNLYPLISPSVLPVISQAGIPVIMWVANYRMMCPTGLYASRGKICERCNDGREYWCVLKNCANSLPKSFGYALRNSVARRAGWYRKHVSAFLCASEFLKQKLIAAGFEESRIHAVPNHVPDVSGPYMKTEQESSSGSYVGYVGRISSEKGISTLLQAAALCPSIKFQLAGRRNIADPVTDLIPSNVQFAGFKKGTELSDFYRHSRFVVNTSNCYETFGMSVAEAMLHRRAVIVPRIGVFPEWVTEPVNGLIFAPGNARQLADRIGKLWNNPHLCKAMGQAGRKIALQRYSADAYYDRFLKIVKQLNSPPAAIKQEKRKRSAA